jgi:two-component system, OmpR family, sensor kinase
MTFALSLPALLSRSLPALLSRSLGALLSRSLGALLSRSLGGRLSLSLGGRLSLSLRARLSLLFFALFATIAMLGLASAWSLSHANEVTTDLRDRWLPNVRLLGDLNNFTSDYRTAEANSLLAAGSDERNDHLRDMRMLDQAVIRSQHDYEQIHHGAEEAALYQQFSTTWALYKTIAAQVTALSASGHAAEASAMYRARSRITYDAASDLLGQLTEYNVTRAAQASERSARAYAHARWLLAAALAAAALMLTCVIAQVRRKISFPLLDLGQAMHLLAANDTSVAIGHTDRGDEIGEMARAVVVFRANAIELMQSQRGLAQQAIMLEEKLAHEQSVTQMQRNFVSMITHEFRTPLTQIDAQAQRLANLKDRLLPEDICDRTSRIRAAVTRIVRMIDQLVDTTRLMDDDTRLFFHPERIDLVAVLHQVCRVQREISPHAQIIEDLGSRPLLMSGDPKLLFQVFSNLVANAIKYSPARAKAILQARQVGERIIVTVEDSGIGIPAQDRARIFRRYHRGSNVSGFVGSGVGLFLVATVMRLHAGEILVDSTEGKGSRFTATLRGDAGQL